MDTQSPATIEVPNFKLAKVGKERERRRAGGGWLSGGRGAGSAFSGAMGGAGAGGGAGLFGLSSGMARALLTLLISALSCAGAWQYGKLMAGRNAAAAKSNSKIFDDKGAQKYDDLSGVVKADNSIPNSLGYVSGSMDGLTPEERAKRAAEAEAARKAEEDAKKKAEEEANKQPAEPASKAADPAATAESAVPKKGLTPGKFGQLGSFGGGGGGLSGGAGLSGGINRNFAGMGNLSNKGMNGAMASFRNPTKPGSSSAPHAAIAKSKSKGFAKQQLDNAFAQSRQAMSAGKGETAASGAAAPFDNNPGQGNVIAGPGVGNSGPSGNGDGGNSLNPTNNGGPLGNPSGAACSSADQAPDINGVCQTIASPAPKNAAPYQWMIQLAEGLMALAAVLSIVILILEKSWMSATSAGQVELAASIAAAEHAIKTIVGVIGGVVCALGLAILAMTGDKMIGGIVAAAGGFIAYTVFTAPELLTDTQWINMAVGSLVASSVGALAASQASSTQLQ